MSTSQYFKRKMKELGKSLPQVKPKISPTSSMGEQLELFEKQENEGQIENVVDNEHELVLGLGIATRKLGKNQFELLLINYDVNGVDAQVVERKVYDVPGYRFDMIVKEFVYENGLLGIKLENPELMKKKESK